MNCQTARDKLIEGWLFKRENVVGKPPFKYLKIPRNYARCLLSVRLFAYLVSHAVNLPISAVQ